jgi:hypothetical protein
MQPDVILHSDVNEPFLKAAKNRLDLNVSTDVQGRNQLQRKANSLMTVYEHGSNNETTMGDSSTSRSDTWRVRSPSSVNDLVYQQRVDILPLKSTSDEQETVNL